MSVKYAFAGASLPIQDLPSCGCGADVVNFWVDVEVEGRQVFLVGHVACDECGYEPPFVDSGEDAASWRAGILRCANFWSSARGGIVYPAIARLPDRLDDLVDFVEARFGPLPEYRFEVLQKHLSRGHR